MPLPEAFWEQPPQKTDLELFEVLLQRDDYLPEALLAVEEEMRKRNLSPRSLAEVAAAVTRSRMRVAQIEADEHQRRHFAKFTFHVFHLWFAIPLGLLIKLLIPVIMGS